MLYCLFKNVICTCSVFIISLIIRKFDKILIPRIDISVLPATLKSIEDVSSFLQQRV